MSGPINRRKFLFNTALTAAGTYISSTVLGSSSQQKDISMPPLAETAKGGYNIMRDVKKYRKLDAHVHLSLGSDDINVQKKHALVLLDYCDRLGVDKLYLSNPVTRIINGVPDGRVESFINNNNLVLNIMKMHPDKFSGSFTFNPMHPKESLEEIKRCVGEGMVSAKVYYQVKINDPLFYPLIEKMIDLKMIMLMHAEAQIGVGGYRMKYNGNKPSNVSIPEDFVDIAKRYPEAMFQFAHIGGGGDWEYMCKTLANSPNVYVDTSGSNNEEHMIDFAIKTLGEDRVVFGSDNCYYQSVGKVLASNLTEAQKKKLFFENFNNILRKAGNNVH
ncbi:amidohydrolase family protein [Mucilaginibacter boryungensis]|uniref:amidohydrolase family protein n=1 Tax=Mucilaginibacter boryungensis TaxID=768480 RepID=UPI001D16324C|nr:amidohydrolase family protein [Mucilaginibacter boryungensis]